MIRKSGTIEAALLTGGFDKPYVIGLSKALLSTDVCVDVVGGDNIYSEELRGAPQLRFLSLKRGNGKTDCANKLWALFAYYLRLLSYAAVAKPRIFHILWNNRLEICDRTLLMLYYRVLGKKLVLTAHNVNAAERDSNDSSLNRLTLRIQYRLADHIFVHTDKMKSELIRKFCIRDTAVSVIPFGINDSVPNTALTSADAKRSLGVMPEERTILFFGAIRPYKGLEFLVEAFLRLARGGARYRLVIAGERRKGSEEYFARIKTKIDGDPYGHLVIQRINYISDDETELFFKAADVLALPYTNVFQSGVLFLAYAFGLPVIASDVGSFREDIVSAQTGYVFRAADAIDLAKTIEVYFESDLYKSLGCRRAHIRNYAEARHSWSIVGEGTRRVYEQLLSDEVGERRVV